MSRSDTDLEKRIEILHSFGIMDSKAEKEFDNIAKLAARICDVPMGKVNFLDNDRIWSKANYGNDIKETSLTSGFCHYTIQNDNFMVVENAAKDERFKELELVRNDPKIRFYAGWNIKKEGYNLGTICVFGVEPKTLSDHQLEALQILANELESELELRRKTRELEMTSAFLEASVDLMLVVNKESGQIEKVSQKVESLLGVKPSEVVGQPIEAVLPNTSFLNELREWEQLGDQSFKSELAFLKDEEEFFLEAIVTKDENNWLITANNITKRKQVERKYRREKKLSDTIINALPINFYMYDDEGNAIRWNMNTLRSSGYTSEDIRSRKPWEFLPESEHERFTEFATSLNGQPKSIETILRARDGRLIPYLVSMVTFETKNEKYYIGAGQDISRMKKYQNKLEELLAEKEILFREVHHRVKNNLAVISGFLQLEEFMSHDKKTKSVLMANHMRVKSMAMIHEELYRVEDFTQLSFGKYLKRLIKNITENRCPPDKNIQLHAHIESVSLNLNQAVPCALIINELVSNAFIYAFEGRKRGNIYMEFRPIGNKVFIKVKDDGIGLPPDFVLEESPTLGATLISTLSEQIDSNLEVLASPGEGAHFELVFTNQRLKKGSSTNYVLT
ncbi:MAG: PAS domain S-box protein [Balneolaceae bacterium]|nr:PAS domain S-box protein [Balneolaceae bacterium]